MGVRWILAAVVAVVGWARARGAEFVGPVVKGGVVMDGRMGDREWEGAVRVSGVAWEGQLERRKAEAWVMGTETHLYIAMRSQLPGEGELLAAVDRDVVKVVFDDSVEVWVDPTPGSGDGAAYQMIVNPRGRRYFARHGRGSVSSDGAWEGGWAVAQRQEAGAWVCEVAIPLASVGGRRIGEGAWGINVCRNWKRPWAFSSIGGGKYAPGEEVRFRFAADAVTVGHEQRRDVMTGEIESVVTLVNGTGKPAAVRAVQRLVRDRMPELKVEERVELVAGERREVALRVMDVASANLRLGVEVVGGEGAGALYRREVGWKAERGAWAWRTKAAAKPAMDVQFAYAPYLERMRVAVDVSGMGAEGKVEGVGVAIRRAGGGEVVKRVRVSGFDAAGRAQTEFALGGLEGEYELAARAEGPGVSAGEVVKPLDRRRYPWEKNSLGKSEEVYAPFAPLKVEYGKEGARWARVGTTLCAHEVGGSGLWNQVVGRSAQTKVERPVLRGPMRYVMRVDGVERAVESALTCTTERDGRAVLVSRMEAGDVTIHSTQRWDVDGMMWVELVLPDAAGQSVEALTLEVPFRNEAAPMMHAMAEGIREAVVTQRVPAGEGVVWSSAKLPVIDFPKNFCSYIYVGDAVRGICWFAENDKGWGWDAKTPNVELARKGDALTLRVHLINQRVTLDKERRMAFGLQAAPVKPRLSPWRYRWHRERYSLLGTDINWLALGDCGSVYPAGKDLQLWEMIRRGNVERLGEAEVEGVIARGRKYWEPYGPEAVKTFIAHARHNLRSRYGTKMVFYYNRASYQAAEEFQTFQDEWGLTEYRTVGPGKGIGEIKIVPSESYIDHALWWYGKSFEAGGNLGVYWDNWFVVPSFNPATTDAYVREDGTAMPAAGILGMRELCRRTFQYMNERKMKPITMPHMTSTNILPMHGFATVQYDWEWKYSEGDVQDRFSREYVLLVSNGELAGTWPVLLGEHGAQGNDAWTQRTFAAVSIVHELDPQPTMAGVWKPLIEPIVALLDEPGLEVYRYWDEREQPVRTDHADLPSIVYVVPGKEAVAAVTSYADREVEAVVRIDGKAMGMEAWEAVDVETGEVLKAEGGGVRLKVKKHDIREMRIKRR